MARYNYDIVQHSDEWLQARLGKVTGTKCHPLLGSSATKQDMLWELRAERLYNDSDREEFQTFYMDRGNSTEPEARRVYSAVNEVDVREVGLVEPEDEFDGYAACSPDGLVDEDGIIEIKCLVAKFHDQYTTEGSPKYNYIKPEYKTQVQFNLFITERQWCDFVYYHPRGGIHVIRIERDEEVIEKIKNALREVKQFMKDNLK